MAKNIHMEYGELKAELERMEREREEIAERNLEFKRQKKKWKELKESGREKEAKEFFDKWFDEVAKTAKAT